jgi:chorismate lyase
LKADALALLTEQGSLTDLMARLMGQPPQLQCLTQGRGQASPMERQILSIKPRTLAHIREITMGTAGQDWLFARTVIPVNTLRGSAKRLARMNSTPLGRVLFGQINAQRQKMWLSLVFPSEVGLGDFNIPADFPLWQRRSVFLISSGPLLINEIFLPDCPVYEEHLV